MRRPVRWCYSDGNGINGHWKAHSLFKVAMHAEIKYRWSNGWRRFRLQLTFLPDIPSFSGASGSALIKLAASLRSGWMATSHRASLLSREAVQSASLVHYEKSLLQQRIVIQWLHIHIGMRTSSWGETVSVPKLRHTLRIFGKILSCKVTSCSAVLAKWRNEKVIKNILSGVALFR